MNHWLKLCNISLPIYINKLSFINKSYFESSNPCKEHKSEQHQRKNIKSERKRTCNIDKSLLYTSEATEEKIEKRNIKEIIVHRNNHTTVWPSFLCSWPKSDMGIRLIVNYVD